MSYSRCCHLGSPSHLHEQGLFDSPESKQRSEHHMPVEEIISALLHKVSTRTRWAQPPKPPAQRLGCLVLTVPFITIATEARVWSLVAFFPQQVFLYMWRERRTSELLAQRVWLCLKEDRKKFQPGVGISITMTMTLMSLSVGERKDKELKFLDSKQKEVTKIKFWIMSIFWKQIKDQELAKKQNKWWDREGLKIVFSTVKGRAW